jgi:hypothetical protein
MECGSVRVLRLVRKARRDREVGDVAPPESLRGRHFASRQSASQSGTIIFFRGGRVFDSLIKLGVSVQAGVGTPRRRR